MTESIPSIPRLRPSTAGSWYWTALRNPNRHQCTGADCNGQYEWAVGDDPEFLSGGLAVDDPTGVTTEYVSNQDQCVKLITDGSTFQISGFACSGTIMPLCQCIEGE